MKEKFATIQEVRDKVKALSRLEGVVKLDNEGVRYLLHDVPFNLGAFHLVRANDKVFLQRFDSINLTIVLLFGQVHLTERTATYHLH